MGKKSGRKRAQNPSDFLVRVTAPADAGTFVDAFTALMDRLERPYVVTHEEKRPSFCLSDTGQAFTLNTDHLMVRLCTEAREYCRKRNIEVDRYAGPIAMRILALLGVVTALAATFPVRIGKMAFDSALFLEELLATEE